MFRLIGAAALALAAANPVLAQGKGADRGNKDHAGHQNAGQNPGNAKAERGGNGNRGGGEIRGQVRERGNGQRSSQPDPSARGEVARTTSVKPERLERAVQSGDRGPNRAALQRTREWDRSNQRRRDATDRADYRDGTRDLRQEDRDRLRERAGRVQYTTWRERERYFASVPRCPPGLARKNNGCLPPGIARQQRDDAFGYSYRPSLFGVPLRTSADYAYHDGYLVPSGGGSGGLARYLPLLGGALAVGQIWPEAYPSLPLSDWQSDYYGFDDPEGYRYADNVVYQVDPDTSAIESIVALLTGSDFAVGQAMPDGYDIYNVPDAYQDEYVDSDEAMYRYADGQVYEIDPSTMLIEQVIGLIA